MLWPEDQFNHSAIAAMITEAEIRKMSKEERLETIHKLWDSLRESPENEPESPEWHAQVLAERTRRIEAGEEVFLSIDDARAQVAEFKACHRK
jgi:Putative addiction module component